MANVRTNLTNNDAVANTPKLNLSEGTRQALEMYGYAISTASGVMLVGSGSDDACVVSETEYLEAVKAHQRKLKTNKTSNLV